MTIKNTEQIQDFRKKRKQQMRLEQSIKKSYEKSLEKPPDVFAFLNNRLSKCYIYIFKIKLNIFFIFCIHRY